jgi:hypothetical protein
MQSEATAEENERNEDDQDDEFEAEALLRRSASRLTARPGRSPRWRRGETCCS